MTFPTVTVEAAFGDGPLEVPTYADDLSGRLQKVQWTIGRTRDLDDWLPGGFSIEFDNSDRELDPAHASGPYFGDLVPRVPIRVQVTHDSTTYNLLHGFAGEDGWEQTYQPPEVAECSVRCTDLMGVLAGRRLGSVLEYEILGAGPTAYWPMGEDQGLTMRDVVGDAHGVYLSGSTQLATTIAVDGVRRCAAIDFDGEHWAMVDDSAAVVPDGSYGVVFAVDTTDADGQQSCFQQGTGDAADGISIGFEADATPIAGFPKGTCTFYVSDQRVTGVTKGRGSATVAPGPALIVMWRDGPAVSDLNVRIYTADTTSSEVGFLSYQAQSVDGTWIGRNEAGASLASFEDGHLVASLGSVAVFDSALDSSIANTLGSAFTIANDGDSTGERIGFVVEDMLDVPAALTDLDAGLTALGVALTEEYDALDYITTVNRTEQGILTVAHWDDGQLRFIGRDQLLTGTRHVTSQATFTDKAADLDAGEYRYEPNLRIEPASINSVINQVTVNYPGGSVSVDDAASIASYGPRGRTFDTLHANPNEARSFAEYVLTRHAQPITRVRELTIDCAADPNGLGAALTLRPGDRVTVERNPQGIGAPFIGEYLIEGINGQIANGVNTFEVTYYLSPADTMQFGLWGDNWGTSLWAY